jgi:hypothetical protein
LTDQQANDNLADDVENPEEDDSLLIEPYAKFREVDKIKALQPNAEEGEDCSPNLSDEKPISENLYAKVNKMKRQVLEGGEMSNQSDEVCSPNLSDRCRFWRTCMPR